MAIDRKQFMLGLTTAAIAPGLQSAEANAEGANDGGAAMPTTPRAAHQTTYFFKNSAFEYVFLTALGRAYHQVGNVGKVLYLSRQVQDGDFEGAFLAFKGAGDEASALADASLAKGHRESARQAYLWAQNYYDTATYFVDGSRDPSRFLPTWERLDACWASTISLFQTPGEQVAIPYEGVQLRGFFFRAPGATGKRPLLIMNNGSDGSLLDMLTLGGFAALARGYDVLTFDGPGQGYALWKQNLHFRPDWEKVITPVVDYALRRSEVDPKRIALLGISQGGYWVPRALAFEKRIAAGVADPGVVDVSSSWTASLPKPMLDLLAGGNKAEFDAIMARGARSRREGRAWLPHAAVRLRFLFRHVQGDRALSPGRRGRADRLPDACDGAGQRGLLAGPVAAPLRHAAVGEGTGCVHGKRRGRPPLRARGLWAARSQHLRLARRGARLAKRPGPIRGPLDRSSMRELRHIGAAAEADIGEPGGGGGRGERLAEQIALADVAADIAQDLRDIGDLDALGRRLHVE